MATRKQKAEKRKQKELEEQQPKEKFKILSHINEFAGAYGLFATVVLGIFGFWFAMRENRKSSLLEMKNMYLHEAHFAINQYNTKEQLGILDSTDIWRLRGALHDIQFYGDNEEIRLARNFIKFLSGDESVAKITTKIIGTTGYIIVDYDADTLTNLMKNNLRKEYKLDKSEYPFTKVLHIRQGISNSRPYSKK